MKGGEKVKKPKVGRRFAIGDIHGCYHTFASLVEDKIGLTQKDQLFLLGDYINKGSRSREVLDYILELKEAGNQIYPLMGNHEYLLLRDVALCEKSKNPVQIKDLIESIELLGLNGRVEERYLEFMQSLPYYYKLDNFILVHAGLDFKAKNPLSDKMSMISARDYDVDLSKTNGRILIHGHTPTHLDEIERQIITHKKLGRINLDNGCVYKRYELEADRDLGRLCALNLDSMELVYCDYMD